MATSPEENDLILRSVRHIDGKVVGNTFIYTPPVNRYFYPQAVRVEAEKITSQTGVPTLSVGTNAPDFNNILGATSLANITATKKHQNFLIANGAAIDALTESVAIYTRVSVAGLATTFLLNVGITGIEEDVTVRRYSVTATSPLTYKTVYYNTGSVFVMDEADLPAYTGLVTVGEQVA